MNLLVQMFTRPTFGHETFIAHTRVMYACFAHMYGRHALTWDSLHYNHVTNVQIIPKGQSDLSRDTMDDERLPLIIMRCIHVLV